MITVLINTATTTAFIAIQKDNAWCIERWENIPQKTQESSVLLDSIMRRENIAYGDISRVVVCKGPGAFSSVRVGVSIANTIAHTCNAEVDAIDTFSLLNLLSKETNKVLIKANTYEVFLKEIGKDPQVMRAENVPAGTYIADISDEQKKKNPDITCVLPEFTDEICSALIKESEKCEVPLAPYYGRPPKIATKKKE